MFDICQTLALRQDIGVTWLRGSLFCACFLTFYAPDDELISREKNSYLQLYPTVSERTIRWDWNEMEDQESHLSARWRLHAHEKAIIFCGETPGSENSCEEAAHAELQEAEDEF